ncbi:MAG: M23 family metallopeptidase [Gemmatimonadales bacterium]
MPLTRTGPRLATGLLLLAAACGPSDDGPLEPDPDLARCTQDFGDPGLSPYRLPFGEGVSYQLIQGYCPPNPNWGHHGWLAYDFDLAIGDTVIASRAGTVTYVEERWPDSDRVCGHENAVHIRHDDGTVMGYYHFTTNGALVTAGQRVADGQPIGRSGDSGCSSGPHLHVMLFRNGTSFGKENTIPLNYHDADGPVDVRGGLVQDAFYRVRPAANRRIR